MLAAPIPKELSRVPLKTGTVETGLIATTSTNVRQMYMIVTRMLLALIMLDLLHVSARTALAGTEHIALISTNVQQMDMIVT